MCVCVRVLFVELFAFVSSSIIFPARWRACTKVFFTRIFCRRAFAVKTFSLLSSSPALSPRPTASSSCARVRTREVAAADLPARRENYNFVFRSFVRYCPPPVGCLDGQRKNAEDKESGDGRRRRPPRKENAKQNKNG